MAQEEANTDVNNTAAPQDTAPAEPSATENNDLEVTDNSLDELWDSATEKIVEEPVKAEPETEDKPATEDEEPEKESEDSKEDEPVEETEEEAKLRGKPKAEERIRSLANENRELRQQIEQLNAQAYKPLTEQELVEQGYSETDAKVEALNQRFELQNFNERVVELNRGIESEASQALQDFPIFNPDSEEYNADIATKASAMYAKTAQIQTDPKTGLIYQANVMPYEFYKTIADTYQISQRNGQLRGQKAAERNLARVEPKQSAAPKAPKADPIADIWASDD